MRNTSQGFHTVTIYKKLEKKEARKLIMDFQNYQENTGEIKFFPLRKAKKVPDGADEFIKWLHSSFSEYYITHYANQNRGILWLLRYSNCSPGFIKQGEVDKPCSIKVTINPKILTGENDYLAAATEDYLEDVESLFNAEAERISPVLGKYSSYSINRPDYCINFDLGELAIPCTPNQMIYLIKRGDIPRHYSEWAEYDEISKRMQSDKNSFYLKSNSVTINCYWKQKQLSENFQLCPDFEASRNLVRFEIQCNYLKTYTLSKK